VGIEVSTTSVVTINDTHENGVDTSVGGNPSSRHFKGMPVLYVFSRNSKGGRRDDGNPLIHALKGRRGFSIMPFWQNQLMTRAEHILLKANAALQGFDYCVPVPSSSPFCATFAALVSKVSGAPVLPPTFVSKKSVGTVLAEGQLALNNIRHGLRSVLTSQLHAWEGADHNALYQAKELDLRIRPLFGPFVYDGQGPDLKGKRVLIVDDLFASGSSLLSMRHILQDDLGADVAAVCFLSGA